MATQDLKASVRSRAIGDSAIDGLLGGIVAGLIMVLFLLVVGALSSDGLAEVIRRFDPKGSGDLVTGLLTHLAVSATYGAIFGLAFLALARLRPASVRYGWLAGLFYGLLIFAIARGAIWAGANTGLVGYSAAVLLLAHALYGVVIGFVIGRKWGKVNEP